jgi:nucleoside phosphorylase
MAPFSYSDDSSEVILLFTLTNSDEQADRLKQVIQNDVQGFESIELPRVRKYTGRLKKPYRIYSGARNGQRLIFCFYTYTQLPECVAIQQILIDKFRAKLIIFFANGGGLKDDTRIGDIYIPSIWHYHDRGIITEKGFVGWYETINKKERRSLGSSVNSGLLSEIRKIDFAKIKNFVQMDNNNPEVKIGGVGVTGNSWLDSKTRRAELVGILNADVVDERAAGIIEAADFNQVPSMYIASVIDLAGKESYRPKVSIEVGNKNFADGVFNSYLVALKIVDNLNELKPNE